MLTGFQLRTSIGILKIRLTDLGQSVGLNRVTISNLLRTHNTEYIRCYTDTMLVLEKFFKENNILFPDDLSVSLHDNYGTYTSNTGLLNVFQLRAGRSALNLTIRELAQITKIKVSTLSKLEQNSITEYIKSTVINPHVFKKIFTDNLLSFPNDFTIRIDKR